MHALFGNETMYENLANNGRIQLSKFESSSLIRHTIHRIVTALECGEYLRMQTKEGGFDTYEVLRAPLMMSDIHDLWAIMVKQSKRSKQHDGRDEQTI
jgi:hypothetical protein